ncbi:exosortase A [Thalassotalea ganghwensis]
MSDNRIKGLISFAFLLLAWGWFFNDAIVGMESIWRRSDTFAHGYFILPISLWLIWRDKTTLVANEPTTSWFALPVLLGTTSLGLIAQIADINVISQLAAVLSLITIIWLIIGDRLTWYYKFPLAYLLFLVPMGENLIPWLQDATAWFTVFFLQLTGIPVFRDGLYIQTPSGLFEVAVACSGIRYLIASAAVGALFAYLNYNKFKKQFIFFVFALLLPILANGIRAYLIVAIAHYSDMKYATGADHLVYGWLFFGFVIMVMFWVGSKFADPETVNKNKIASSNNQYRTPPVAAALIAILSASYLLKQLPVIQPSEQPDALLSGKMLANSDWGIDFKNPLASSTISKQSIEWFAAKYGNKQAQGELISFNNQLHNMDRWTVVEREDIEHDASLYRYVVLRNTSGEMRSYLYQYIIGSYTAVAPSLAKIYQVLSAFTAGVSYSYIIAVSHPLMEATPQDRQLLLEQAIKLKQQLEVNP